MDMKSASANQRSFRNRMTHFCPLTHNLLNFKKILFLYFYESYCCENQKSRRRGYRRITTVQMWVYQGINGLVRTSLNLRTRVPSTCTCTNFHRCLVCFFLRLWTLSGGLIWADKLFEKHVQVSVALLTHCFGIRYGQNVIVSCLIIHLVILIYTYITYDMYLKWDESVS